MKIALVVGARPNYFKAKPILSRLDARDDVSALLVHTGQHHDPELFQDLFRQLCVPTYTKKAGRICVQSKEEIVKLLGRSPDKGDACVYGNFVRPRRRRKPAPQEEKIDRRNVDRGLERRLARHNKRIAREERMIKRLLKKRRTRSER